MSCQCIHDSKKVRQIDLEEGEDGSWSVKERNQRHAYTRRWFFTSWKDCQDWLADNARKD